MMNKNGQKFGFDETQTKAISLCCDVNRRVVPVTGAAGTGKTTILQSVHKTLKARGYNVVLCAPTGKAAKRIQEATGIPARTIHRLLEYPYPGERDEKTGKTLISTDPKKDRQDPIEYNAVLVDEYAMVSVEVHRNLLAALPHGGIIRMFGDANQLQPIESSKRLQAEPSSFITLLDKYSGPRLTTIHRQKENSNIIANANRIIVGGMPVRKPDFSIQMTNSPVTAIEEFVQDSLLDGIDFGITKNQMITPTKVGWVGTEALNGAVQNLLHPSNKTYTEVERHKWVEHDYMRMYEGDKVIYTTNNYPLEVFNGETGVITSINADASISVDFGDRTLDIPVSLEMEGKDGEYFINPQKDLDLAYVITTHKAQGSEYERVCYIMNSSRSWLLNRKNLYTAVTRAKEYVHIITDQKSLSRSLYKVGDK
jgi:exodeoxyribonuclease V alpha subunit